MSTKILLQKIEAHFVNKEIKNISSILATQVQSKAENEDGLLREDTRAKLNTRHFKKLLNEEVAPDQQEHPN